MGLQSGLASLFPRVISAIIAIGLLWAALGWEPYGILFLTLLIVVICAHEFCGLAFDSARLNSHKLAFILFTALTYLAFAWLPDLAVASSVILWVSLMASLLARVRPQDDLVQVVRTQGLTSLGMVYCGIIPSFAARIVQWEDRGPLWLITLLALVFVGDTFAYFVGLSIGRRKLFPAISPKKTVEGAMGGIAGTLTVGLALRAWFFPEIPVLFFLFLCLVTALFAQTGDFFESLLKRAANVKDSGQIMPGHGGLLDRLDGVLFALPFYYGVAYALKFLV